MEFHIVFENNHLETVIKYALRKKTLRILERERGLDVGVGELVAETAETSLTLTGE